MRGCAAAFAGLDASALEQALIIERRNVMHWLDGTLPNEVLFEEPPRHTLFVEPLRAQAALPL